MPRITKEKLDKPFERMNTLDLDYVQKAKDVAKRLNAGEKVEQWEIAEIRLGAVNDRNNLKGDFVISCYMDILESFERWTKGKSLKATDALIKSVYYNRHELTVKAKKNKTVRDFCATSGISCGKYYRIANKDVTNPHTLSRLKKIEQEVDAQIKIEIKKQKNKSEYDI